MEMWILENDGEFVKQLGEEAGAFFDEAGVDCTIEYYNTPTQVSDALWQNDRKPAIIFISPELSDKNLSGLMFAYEIYGKKMDISIVLVSGSDRYAYEGYMICAEGYIWYGKPVKEQVVHTLERLLYRYELELKKLKISVHHKVLMLPLYRIMYIESDNHYSVIHTEKGVVYKSYVSLSKLYLQLQDWSNFIMIGKGYVVNIIHISSFTKEEIVLNGGVRITIPVRHRKNIYGKLMERIL